MSCNVNQPCRLQDGSLAKSMKELAKKGHEAVADMEAVKTLATTQADGLDDIAAKLGGEGPSLDLEPPKDITFDFLKSTHSQGPWIMATDIFVYRGLVQALLGRMDDVGSKIGIMAGENNAVLEVCIADDVSSALANSELEQRWKASNLEILGLVMWNDKADVAMCQEPMATLLSCFSN